VDVVRASSATVLRAIPDGANGAVLQDASVSPFTGGASTNFTWTVTVYPQYDPTNTSGPVSVTLYVSTCPGATGNSSPYCSGGYPLLIQTHRFSQPLVQPTNVTFHLVVDSNGIWSWQMGVAFTPLTPPPQLAGSGGSSYVFLQGASTSGGIEGPVVGSFVVTYAEILPTIYATTFVYLGVPFYVVLLLYMLLKSRERRRNDARRRAAGAIPPTTGGGETLAGPAPAPPSAPGGPPTDGATPAAEHEKSCPKCSAVVYAGEANCWKCGASLATTAPPLPSEGPA